MRRSIRGWNPFHTRRLRREEGRPSTRPGPRSAKERQKAKEMALETRRRMTEDSRRKKREENIEGRRGVSPEDSEADSFVRMMSRASSTSTINDVSDAVLGEGEDLPATGKESSREVSPATFPRASAPSACGKRGRGRPPTTGEYVGYEKAQRKASEARQRALDLDAEEELARTGLAAQFRMEKASQQKARRRGRRGLATGRRIHSWNPRETRRPWRPRASSH